VGLHSVSCKRKSEERKVEAGGRRKISASFPVQGELIRGKKRKWVVPTLNAGGGSERLKEKRRGVENRDS